ncbi:MAG: hypothetical protein WDN49_23635 [Acetobacteraceae bacterium]
MLSLPDTSMKGYIDAEQTVERLRDGYADYFSRYDALITHVLPIQGHKHADQRAACRCHAEQATSEDGTSDNDEPPPSAANRIL